MDWGALAVLGTNALANMWAAYQKHRARGDLTDAYGRDRERIERNNQQAYQDWLKYAEGQHGNYLDYLGNVDEANAKKEALHREGAGLMMGAIPKIRRVMKPYLQAGRQVMPLKTMAFAQGIGNLGKLSDIYFSDAGLRKAALPTGQLSSIKLPKINPA